MNMVELDYQEPTNDELYLIEREAHGVNTTQIYLREIGRVPLLTAVEEISLARTIEKQKYLPPMLLDAAFADGGIDPLQAGRIIDSLNQDAQIARRHLTEANLRLVVSIAKKHRNKGVDFEDLVQEGNCGLMHAVEKFDYHKGFRFSTYATWWIRQAVTRSIADQARTIRLPVHMVESGSKVGHAVFYLQQELERDPTAEEISRNLGDSFSVERVTRILTASQYPISLDTPIPDSQAVLGDSVVDASAHQELVDTAEKNSLKTVTVAVLKSLTPRERLVLEMRYGLHDGIARTLEEIGRHLGVTRERIRQIEAKALRKLKHPSRSKHLRAYLE